MEPLSAGDQRYQDGALYLADLIQNESRSLSGYERNRFYQNVGGGEFVEAGYLVGIDLVEDGRGVAAGDIDSDGDLDLVVSNRNRQPVVVLRNEHGSKRAWLAVDLKGTHSNRQGVGSWITVRCGNGTQVHYTQLGTGFASQSAVTAWFGLQDCRQVESLEVRWPSGRTQIFAALPVNRRIVLVEGSANVETPELPGAAAGNPSPRRALRE